jgi:hypothetical protein
MTRKAGQYATFLAVSYKSDSLGFFVSASATTLSLESLQIELVSGWVHSIEKVGTPGSELGDQVSVRHPDGVGVLYLQTYSAPAVVSDAVLRRMTNVPMTVSMVKRQWGEFSGYHHDYVENENHLPMRCWSTIRRD